jgi:dethiobiotin synthetase
MNVFVSADNTDSGKTYATLKLIEAFSKKGYKVGVMKPIETGVKKFPEDGKKLFELAVKYNPELKNLSLNDIVPVQMSLPAAPFVAGKTDFEKIKSSYEKIKSVSDVVLIEGAGGLLVPITDSFKMIDFLEFFNAELLMVFSGKLGIINNFLLNKYFLEKEKIPYVWCVNVFDKKDYYEITHPYLKRYDPLILQEDLDKITKKLIKEHNAKRIGT